MFEIPTNEKMCEIIDEVPGIVDCVFYKKGGYLQRVKNALAMKRILDDLGIKITYPISTSSKYIQELVTRNNIPDFAVLKTVDGEYKISFGNDYEKDPIITLTNNYYKYCTDSCIYVLSATQLSRQAIKCIRRCAVRSCENLLTKDVAIFR